MQGTNDGRQFVETEFQKWLTANNLKGTQMDYISGKLKFPCGCFANNANAGCALAHHYHTHGENSKIVSTTTGHPSYWVQYQPHDSKYCEWFQEGHKLLTYVETTCLTDPKKAAEAWTKEVKPYALTCKCECGEEFKKQSEHVAEILKDVKKTAKAAKAAKAAAKAAASAPAVLAPAPTPKAKPTSIVLPTIGSGDSDDDSPFAIGHGTTPLPAVAAPTAPAAPLSADAALLALLGSSTASDLAAAEKKITDLTEVRNKLTARIEELSDELKKKEAELATLKSMGSTETKKLSDELDAIKATILKKNVEITSLDELQKATAANSKAIAAKAREKIQEAEEKAKKAEEETLKAEEKAKKAEEETLKAEEKAKKAEEEALKALAETSHAKAEANKSVTELKVAANKIVELNTEIAQAKKETKAAAEKAKKAEEQATTAATEIAKLKAELEAEKKKPAAPVPVPAPAPASVVPLVDPVLYMALLEAHAKQTALLAKVLDENLKLRTASP
jgi:hypothetical protein